eukprot:4505264-Heterocapsa_arctica.AAC.1
MVYRWKWDNVKTGPEIAGYGRDGCTRWYPGKDFVRKWDSNLELDPGRECFIEWNKNNILDDSAAKTK